MYGACSGIQEESEWEESEWENEEISSGHEGDIDDEDGEEEEKKDYGYDPYVMSVEKTNFRTQYFADTTYYLFSLYM